jgi:hypothetical protein
LGIGDTEDRFKPTLIMKDENINSIHCFGYSNMILKNNGELFVFGHNGCGNFYHDFIYFTFKNINNSI